MPHLLTKVKQGYIGYRFKYSVTLKISVCTVRSGLEGGDNVGEGMCTVRTF